MTIAPFEDSFVVYHEGIHEDAGRSLVCYQLLTSAEPALYLRRLANSGFRLVAGSKLNLRVEIYGARHLVTTYFVQAPS